MLRGIPEWLSRWFKRIQLKRDIYANGSKRKKNTCCSFAFMLEWNHSFNSGLLSYGCQKLQQNGLKGKGRSIFVLSVDILHDCNHLKRNIMWRKCKSHQFTKQDKSDLWCLWCIMVRCLFSVWTYQVCVFLTEFSALKTLFSILQNSNWRFSVLSTPSPLLDPSVSEALQTLNKHTFLYPLLSDWIKPHRAALKIQPFTIEQRQTQSSQRALTFLHYLCSSSTVVELH